MKRVHLDFETGSACDLIKSGIHRYAEDLSTRIWLFSYWFEVDGTPGPMQRWKPGDPDPIELLQHIADGGIFVVHNAMFERWVWNLVLRIRYNLTHWPILSPYQQDCTMSRAATIAHPQQLEKLGSVLGLTQQKDTEGAALMKKMAKPRKWNPDGTYEWWDTPENIERLGGYCDQDIRTESEADTFLPPLTDSERRVWIFDQIINDRGVHVDMPAVLRCVDLVDYAKKMADSEMRKLTGRTVPKCSNDGKLIAWVQAQGIDCTTVKKGVQDDLLFMADLNDKPIVREVIELRRASKKTSTAKYAAMLKCVSSDSRIRGLLNYHGASTGRWAGRLVQPQNFPRLDYDEEGPLIEWLHDLLADKRWTTQEVYEAITIVHGPVAPLSLLSRALRSMIVAAPGKKLVGGDFSNIEGRMNAWLAGEVWKLQAFRDFDTIIGVDKKGKPLRAGPDLYNLAYAKSFNVGVDSVTKKQRQIGKVEELALGFQGSHGAVLTMGDTYGLDPYTLANAIMAVTDPFLWDETAAKYHVKGTNRFDLQEKEWTAIKIMVDGWRSANSNIVQMWWDLQDAAIAAVEKPGYISYVCGGRVSYYSDARFLWCTLPGGRMLCYSSPEIHSTKVERQRNDGSTYTVYKKSVSYWGVDSETKQWREQYLYGGHQCENIVQAASRDVMVDRMFAAEAEGFPLILTVHDELVTEPDAESAYHNDKTLQAIMSVVPKHFEGLPLAAAAWEDKRYVK